MYWENTGLFTLGLSTNMTYFIITDQERLFTSTVSIIILRSLNKIFIYIYRIIDLYVS